MIFYERFSLWKKMKQNKIENNWYATNENDETYAKTELETKQNIHNHIVEQILW